MACSSHKTRQSSRSASGSSKSPNCPYFRGWSCSCKVNRSPSVSQNARLRCMRERSSQVFRPFSLPVVNRGQLSRSATFGGFTRVSPRNSTWALFDNQPRFFSVKICTDFTSIRTGNLRSRFRAMYDERSLDKHSPFPIHWGSSQFPGRCGISHNHSTRATLSVISGGFPCPSQEFGRRRRIQSWTDQNVHSVGNVRGIHIPTAASPLDGPSWNSTVSLPQFSPRFFCIASLDP
jgi:hypothetical protein